MLSHSMERDFLAWLTISSSFQWAPGLNRTVIRTRVTSRFVSSRSIPLNFVYCDWRRQRKVMLTNNFNGLAGTCATRAEMVRTHGTERFHASSPFF